METQTDKSSEKKKERNFAKYNILLVPQDDSAEVKKVSVRMEFVLGAVVGIVLILLAALIYCYYLSNHIVDANASLNELRTQIEELNEEKKTIETLNEELQEKVTILSDTVNEKVQQEEAREAELAKAYIPTGFPLTGTASYKEETTTLDGQPIAYFEAAEGISVVATAVGTVSAIAGDEEVGYIIMVDHGNDYYSVYRNQSKPKVEEGDEVTTQTELYTIESGKTELGYQIIENNSYIDPLTLMEIYG